MSVYYNEIDPFCCEWLRQLIKLGLLPDGEIDNRSIEDVVPNDVKEFTQCHFFAGIGGWAYALQLAGWLADKPVWTGSCPCQPFSTAGKRKGTSDERHLWPAFFHFINQCKPDTIIGEQVASKDALVWWDLVQSDLEGTGYTCGVCDTPAAGFGAPHIRQRLYWVALSQSPRWGEWGNLGVMGNTESEGLQRYTGHGGTDTGAQTTGSVAKAGGTDGLANATELRLWGNTEGTQIQRQCPERAGEYTQPRDAGKLPQGFERCSGDGGFMPTNGFWKNPDWLWCRDKKWRPVESGLGPLVDGVPARVGRCSDFRAIKQRLKGYGNAIVVPQAVEFIKIIKDLL